MISKQLTDTAFSPSQDVLDGWNEKNAFSSLELSKLTPFINMMAVYDDNIQKEFTKSQITNMTPRISELKVKNPFGLSFQGSLRAIPLFDNVSQLLTQDRKGGEGINSLTITRGTRESFNIRYKMSMTIMDVSVFDEKPEYSSLATLNSTFLVMYGWSGSNGTTFKNPPQIFDSSKQLSVDLAATNKGYWRSELMRLYTFDFSFDEQGYVDVTAEFMSPHNAMLIFIRSFDIMRQTTDLLNSPDADRSPIINSPGVKDIIASDPELKTPVINTLIETKVPGQAPVGPPQPPPPGPVIDTTFTNSQTPDELATNLTTEEEDLKELEDEELDTSTENEDILANKDTAIDFLANLQLDDTFDPNSVRGV